MNPDWVDAITIGLLIFGVVAGIAIPLALFGILLECADPVKEWLNRKLNPK